MREFGERDEKFPRCPKSAKQFEVGMAKMSCDMQEEVNGCCKSSQFVDLIVKMKGFVTTTFKNVLNKLNMLKSECFDSVENRGRRR